MRTIEWISVKTELPKNKEKVIIKGIPSFGTEEIELDIRYFDSVGFISNITHWKPAL